MIELEAIDLVPGQLYLHERNTVVGVAGDDGRLYTHNFTLEARQASRFRPVALEEVPERLRGGYLEAARRRAAAGVEDSR